jgi:hypothetical protein
MVVINKFERSCGTFKGGGWKNPLSSTICLDINLLKKNNNNNNNNNNSDHGVDVNIVMIIYLRYFENNGI